jgi:hypothetical protein
MSESKQIYSLMAEASKRIGVIGKGQTYDDGKGRSWNFRGIDDAMSAAQPVLADLGIAISVRCVDHKSEPVEIGKYKTPGFHDQVMLEVTFYAPDGSCYSSTLPGIALDTSDKATNKALSAAYKNVIYQTFCIGTKEVADNDPDHTAHQISGKGESQASTLPPVPDGYFSKKEVVDWIQGQRTVADSVNALALRHTLTDADRKTIEAIFASEVAA